MPSAYLCFLCLIIDVCVTEFVYFLRAIYFASCETYEYVIILNEELKTISLLLNLLHRYIFTNLICLNCLITSVLLDLSSELRSFRRLIMLSVSS
jgi:predicted nucleic-acid-binding protein